MSEGEIDAFEETKRAGAALDPLDREIVQALREDCRESYRNLAKMLSISTSTLISRVKKLEHEKVITGYRARVDAGKLGYDFFAVTEVTIRKGALLEVQQKIASFPGVAAVYDVTGQSDSLVIAKCRNRQEYSRLVKKILAIEKVERTNTHVILNVVKEDL